MIYLPSQEIKSFGGLNREATDLEFETLNNRLLSRDLNVSSVVKLDGKLAYVE